MKLDQVKIAPIVEDREEINRVIEDGLGHFNRAAGGPSAGRELLLGLFDATSGEALGGLVGRTSYGILYIDKLFVPETSRGSGVGRELLRAAESEAVARGCVSAMLFTYSFQAPGFYLREGYAELGRVEGGDHGRDRIYLKKALRLDSATERTA